MILLNWFYIAGNAHWHCHYANIMQRHLTPTSWKDEHFVILPDVWDNYCNATGMPWSRRLDINCTLVKSHSTRGHCGRVDSSMTAAELMGSHLPLLPKNNFSLQFTEILPSSFLTSTLDGKTTSDKHSYILVSVKRSLYFKDTYSNQVFTQNANS